MKVYIEKLRDDIKLPEYKNIGDAGMDVYAVEKAIIYPGKTEMLPVGFKVAIPDGYELQVRPRSGLAIKGIQVANSPGTIDSGYRDEVGIIIHNSNSSNFFIEPGHRIAQLVLKQVEQCEWEIVDSVEDIGKNRGGGFGSTGE